MFNFVHLRIMCVCILLICVCMCAHARVCVHLTRHSSITQLCISTSLAIAKHRLIKHIV